MATVPSVASLDEPGRNEGEYIAALAVHVVAYEFIQLAYTIAAKLWLTSYGGYDCLQRYRMILYHQHRHRMPAMFAYSVDGMQGRRQTGRRTPYETLNRPRLLIRGPS